MVDCSTTNFKFPMLADIYYPIVEQSAYGNIKRNWMLDKTIAGNFTPAGSDIKEELVVNVDLTQDSLLICRVRSDIRISSLEDNNTLTNILITNIRDSKNNIIYSETSGPRANKATLFEVATQQPFVNAFGRTEHYRVILRRSENQAENV
jgi:hypothetical protein